MISEEIRKKYDQAPHAPGVYLMRDKKGRILYVGKAGDLKKRLASYFVRKDQPDPKTAALLALVDDFDLVMTQSDQEAFILESNLIKAHSPKYNVILKDGKNYPLLRIDMNEPYPSIQRVRRIEKDKALYFGPYSSSRSVNQTLKQIQRIFKLRKCRDARFKNRSRPCLNYQIKACPGLCCHAVDAGEYQSRMKDAVLFLKGRTREVIRKLRLEMAEYAAAQAFEKAARVRDTILAVERIMERQVVVSADGADRDVIGLAWDQGRAVVTVMQVRTGYLIDTAFYPLDLGFKTPDEVLVAFVIQYYEKAARIPGSVLFSHSCDDMVQAREQINEMAGHRVHFHYPVRGEKRRLADMARRNATGELDKVLAQEARSRAGLTMLQHLLGMDRLPERMECFDNSNLQGEDPVAAMVVFTEGRPDRQAYRKFVIRDIEQQDDYAYMTHVLSRRFRHDRKDMPLPDLLVVDGGKGQLSMAVSVVQELGLAGRFTLAGLAKKDADKGETADKIYLPGRSNPLNTAHAVRALFLLAHIRDEAHRCAVTFQRSRREKRGRRSALDGIPGIGPQKRKLLLTTFRGVDNIRKQSPEALAALPGITLEMARKLLQVLSE